MIGLKMKFKLSRKLSSQARKLYVKSQKTDEVSALVKLSPLVDLKQLAAEFKQQQIEVASWLQSEDMVSVKLLASQLSALAEIKGVVFVEAGSKMGSGETNPDGSSDADTTQSKSNPSQDD